MQRLLLVLVLLAAGVAALGFYRGWFTASTGDTGHGANITFGVDRNKIREDEAAVKQKVDDLKGAPKDGKSSTANPEARP